MIHMYKIKEHIDKVIANQIVFQQKIKAYHWNVEGATFSQLHKLFDEQYEEVADMIDKLAERIQMMKEYPLASLAKALEMTTLSEANQGKVSSQDMLKDILESHEKTIALLNSTIEKMDAIGDKGTEDLLIEQLQKHQKMAWMIRATLG